MAAGHISPDAEACVPMEREDDPARKAAVQAAPQRFRFWKWRGVSGGTGSRRDCNNARRGGLLV